MIFNKVVDRGCLLVAAHVDKVDAKMKLNILNSYLLNPNVIHTSLVAYDSFILWKQQNIAGSCLMRF